MATHLVPQDGDVVIRADRREGTLVYVLLAAPGVGQLLVRTRREAVEQAVVFAKRERVGAWLTDKDSEFMLLENFRVMDRPEPEAMPTSLSGHDAALNRIRAEFLEMPGLCLTRDQVQRLCGVERDLCQQALNRLVETSLRTPNPMVREAFGGRRHSTSAPSEGRPAANQCRQSARGSIPDTALVRGRRDSCRASAGICRSAGDRLNAREVDRSSICTAAPERSESRRVRNKYGVLGRDTPRRLVLERTDGGGAAAVEIETANGTKVIVRPTTPGLLKQPTASCCHSRLESSASARKRSAASPVPMSRSDLSRLTDVAAAADAETQDARASRPGRPDCCDRPASPT